MPLLSSRRRKVAIVVAVAMALLLAAVNVITFHRTATDALAHHGTKSLALSREIAPFTHSAIAWMQHFLYEGCALSGTDQWFKVALRRRGESDLEWSTRIYNTMVGMVEDGKGPNANQDILFRESILNPRLAGLLCTNVCRWHGKTPLCACDAAWTGDVELWRQQAQGRAKCFDFPLSIQDTRSTFLECAKIAFMDANAVRWAGMHNAMSIDQDYIQLMLENADRETIGRFISEGRMQVTEEEHQFPIAFSLVVHENPVQVAMLLQAVWKPHNAYCIHVDEKAATSVKDAIGALAALPNVFLPKRRYSVHYGHVSRLLADLSCYRDLLAQHRWLYAVNLCGADYPLVSNLDLVRRLRVLGGRSDVESGPVAGANGAHLAFVHRLQGEGPAARLVRTAERKKGQPPLNMTVFKGSAYNALSRHFLECFFRSRALVEAVRWFKDVWSPDEYFFSSVARLPGAAVAASKFNRSAGVGSLTKSVSHHSAWKGHDDCYGYWRHGICVFAIGDLQVGG